MPAAPYGLPSFLSPKYDEEIKNRYQIDNKTLHTGGNMSLWPSSRVLGLLAKELASRPRSFPAPSDLSFYSCHPMSFKPSGQVPEFCFAEADSATSPRPAWANG
jgi:hypothetical protein